MTKQRFNDLMKQQGDSYYLVSCYHLKLEIVKKIVNCEADEVEKYTLLNQYVTNQCTNNEVANAIKRIGQR